MVYCCYIPTGMITFILKMINANSWFYINNNNKCVKIFIASNVNRLTETQSERNKQKIIIFFFIEKKKHLVISAWRGDVISGKI